MDERLAGRRNALPDAPSALTAGLPAQDYVQVLALILMRIDTARYIRSTKHVFQSSARSSRLVKGTAVKAEAARAPLATRALVILSAN